MDESENKQREITIHMQQAQEMLRVAQDNLRNGYYGSSINRSYYAVFHAANALLLSIDKPRTKHFGVISAFRQYFVKTGLWPAEFSRSYGRILTDRQTSDYQPSAIITQADALDDLQDAEQFVMQAEVWLKNEGWL